MADNKKTAAVTPKGAEALQTYFLPDEQLARIERAILTASVVGGYLANGGRPTTPERVEELRKFVQLAERLAGL